MTVRIGMIGLGDIAEKAYLPVLASHPGITLAGIMSRSEATVERIGSRFRIEGRFTELGRLLSQDLDAVFVHSPTETHYGIVTECLKAGVHVYVDKPLSYEIKESEAMASCAEQADRLLAVGFNRRFAPLYVQAKSWLEQAGGFELCAADKQRTKRQKHSARQTLYDDLIHMIDLVVWLCGDDGRLADYRQAVDGEGRLRFAAGCLASEHRSAAFSMSRGAGLDLERLELHGSGRTAQVVNLERAVFADAVQGATEASFGSWDAVSYRRGFTGAIEHFLGCLHNREDCKLRADLTLATHRLIERMLERA
ncbi:MAG: gfo/Idh/MocA family oxidoreductase [Paenibacillaceae bacterium]|jgi:virulence factor|nr:gfo/Idh/MocA family oxidoreductase [Paenibacillaceae bacterium]